MMGLKNNSGKNLESTSNNLKKAFDILPQLQRRKKSIKNHQNIAAFLLKEIESKQLDLFFDLEQKIYFKKDI